MPAVSSYTFMRILVVGISVLGSIFSIYGGFLLISSPNEASEQRDLSRGDGTNSVRLGHVGSGGRVSIDQSRQGWDPILLRGLNEVETEQVEGDIRIDQRRIQKSPDSPTN